MPPKLKSGKSDKAKLLKARARKARASHYVDRCGNQLSGLGDNEYVHTGSSVTDAESDKEAEGHTSACINYMFIIYNV